MQKNLDLKDRVLRAGIEILNSQGYGGITITEIAKHLNISKQSVYYHFPGSQELVLTIAKMWSESGQLMTLKALANCQEHGAFRVKAIADGMFDWIKEDPELAKVALTLYQISPLNKKLNEFMTRARETGHARLKELLKQDEKFRKMNDKQLNSKVTALHSQMYGAFFYSIAMDQLREVDTIQLTCREAIHSLLIS